MNSRLRLAFVPLLEFSMRWLLGMALLGLILLMSQLFWQRIQQQSSFQPPANRPITIRQPFSAPDFGDSAALPRPHPVIVTAPPQKTNMTYEAMFRTAAASYNLDWQIVAELAYQESLMNPLALGRDNDMGLMQIIPATWNAFAPQAGVTDPFDAYSNIQVGTAYLAYMRDFAASRDHPEMYWAIIGYNWGPDNLDNLWANHGSWADVPPAQQTYALKILQAAANGSQRWRAYEIQPSESSVNH